MLQNKDSLSGGCDILFLMRHLFLTNEAWSSGLSRELEKMISQVLILESFNICKSFCDHKADVRTG